MITTHPSGVAIDALTRTTIIMDANATIGTNNTNNMSTTGLHSMGNNLLQVIGTRGLPALEIVAASGDAFPLLQAAVIEALAIIRIVKVCPHLNHSVSGIYVAALEIQNQ